MVAKLSMLRLPLCESIQCKLLVGSAVAAANASKPIVAFTRSRRMRRTASGLPLRNNVAALSRSDLAKAGSRRGGLRRGPRCLVSRLNLSPLAVVRRQVNGGEPHVSGSPKFR